VRALLEALAADSRANILHAPHVLVSDNREATIRVGDQVPIATSETNISGTSQIQRTIQYRDTGIIFKVKPQVNEGGLVALDISQEVSAFRLEEIFDSTQVVITSRTATTNLVVQDKQTIIIGGLIKEDVQKTRRGIPLLYKIPILGYLFGKTTENYVKTELIMLLTPHVIRNQPEAESVSSQYLDRLDEVKESVNEMKFDLKVDDDTSMEERQHPHGQ
jgi:general secretion pathway protein D